MAFLNFVRDRPDELNGKRGIRIEHLRDAIREDPETAAVVMMAYLRTPDRANLQIALAIALAYESELGDDSLYLLTNRAMKANGLEDIALEILTDTQGQATERPLQLLVTNDFLDAEEIYPFLHALSIDLVEQSDWPRLRTLRGRCYLEFPLDQDPRPVWEIPKARQYIARLFEVMPYFPYYLDPRSDLGMLFLFFASLAKPDAVDGRNLQVDVPEVAATIRHSLSSILDFSRRLGEEGEQVCRQVLSAWPDNLTLWLLEGLE